jgi:hypothetical protein
MSPSIRFAISVVAGVLLGIFSARYMSSESNPMFSESHGSWSSWPAAGDPDANPYTLARFLTANHLPEHVSEVRTFYATHDDEGGTLSAACDYLVKMPRPAVRRWSISLYQPGVPGTPMLSQDRAFSINGTVTVRVSSTAKPGNWLDSSEVSDMKLVFRLFNGGAAASQDELKVDLPSVELERC